MKTATIKELKQELSHRSSKELIELCLRLSRFKKENKELLTYLLYESSNEEDYIYGVKKEIEEQFLQINSSSYYYIAKSIRKILRATKKYIRYSQKKETEIELLIYFCHQMKQLEPSIFRSKVLSGLYERQLTTVKKGIAKLHEDLQSDYENMLEELV